jgi:hypothetical protein
MVKVKAQADSFPCFLKSTFNGRNITAEHQPVLKRDPFHGVWCSITTLPWHNTIMKAMEKEVFQAFE